VSLRKAIIAVWRNLVEGRALDTPRYDDGYQPSVEAQARNALRQRSEELMRTFLPRLPQHLHSSLELIVFRSTTPPIDPLSLMNEFSAWRTGRGIANERGGAPSQEDLVLYQRLGELEGWMDQDLGHPENTQYAVLRRAVEQFTRDSKHSAAS
jgi:hypothetical protein